MNPLLLPAGAVILSAALVVFRLRQSWMQQSGFKLTLPWLIWHLLAGCIFWLILNFGLLYLPPFLESGSTIQLIFLATISTGILLLGLWLLSIPLSDPADLPEPDTKRAKPSWNPFLNVEIHEWHAATAGWTLGGFALGTAFGVTENLYTLDGNWINLAMRQFGTLPLHATSGALLAWGLARTRFGNRKSLYHAIIWTIVLRSGFNMLMVEGWPVSPLAFAIALVGLVVAWRYVSNYHVIRKPRAPRKKWF